MSGYEPAQYVQEEQRRNKPEPLTSSLYMVTHLIISFFAIFLSWRCNNGFNLFSFVVALLCPYLYIIWALATRGGCGVFNQSNTLSLSPVSPLNF